MGFDDCGGDVGRSWGSFLAGVCARFSLASEARREEGVMRGLEHEEDRRGEKQGCRRPCCIDEKQQLRISGQTYPVLSCDTDHPTSYLQVGCTPPRHATSWSKGRKT